MTRALILASVVSLALAASGCPKEEPAATATPVPSATAMTSPVASPAASPIPTTDGAVSSAPWNVSYKWSGGLSIYHYYDLSISGTDTAKVTFKVKPMKQEEIVVEDTLSAEEFAELKGLFAAVSFDGVKSEPRKVRVMDIGQTTIAREIAGGAKHEVMENPNQKATGDIKVLKSWFDGRVRMYLDKAGVGPKKAAPAASPAATPAK